ncbi:transcription factor TFIIIB component B'' [[Candida] jaroonii]|uniref:Transcription factor TFIIIB component B n=1 Tax=[Candida] jaroonii TaxID=467808 RepID=A0ACA9Y8S6_9ASCO|nr:transcription factor TFIIIB component B'' [[Candida] jaroonii]
MSSRVRKGQTSFAPKLKNVRRKVTLPTPESTQKPSQVTFFEKSSDKPIDDEDVDPKDSSKKNDVAVEDDDNDDDDGFDEVLFKHPSRKSSSFSQRRLSGISLNKPGSRKSSISLAIKPRLSIDSTSIPIPIEIPLGKKRRTSSVVVKRPKKDENSVGAVGGSVGGSVSSSIGIDPGTNVTGNAEVGVEDDDGDAMSDTAVAGTIVAGIAGTSADTDKPTEPEPIKPKKHKIARDTLFKQGIKIIYAVGEDSKITKFRTGSIDGGDEGLPLADEEVDLTLTNRRQIPKGLADQPSELLSFFQIDPGFMTMKDLTYNDLPVGKVSENYEMAREAKVRQQRSRDYRRNVRLCAKVRNIPMEEAEFIVTKIYEIVDERKVTYLEAEQLFDKEREERKNNGIKEEINEPKKEPPRISKLQLEIGANGKMEVNAESTIISAQNGAHGDRTVEETNPFERPILGTTYSNRQLSDRWTVEEEEKFFDALAEWGTDFTIISSLFPYRSRRQIKSKFNVEERKRPELIELALSRKKTEKADAREEELTLESLEEFNESIRRIRSEHEAQKRELVKAKEKADKEDAERNRLKEIERRSGKRPLERLTRNKSLRTNEEVVGTLDRARPA